VVALEASAAVQDGRADFDFLVGTWDVQNRRLRERLKGSDQWDEFEGRSVVRHVLGGLGNIDRIRFGGLFAGHEGVTLRLFDPVAREWSLHWSDNTTGKLFTRLVGSFAVGRGVFYAQEAFEGRQVFSRFIWTAPSADSAIWEQAFSDDGGDNWETNWTMQLTRANQDESF
jgi:hypothetical protein